MAAATKVSQETLEGLAGTQASSPSESDLQQASFDGPTLPPDGRALWCQTDNNCSV